MAEEIELKVECVMRFTKTIHVDPEKVTERVQMESLLDDVEWDWEDWCEDIVPTRIVKEE